MPTPKPQSGWPQSLVFISYSRADQDFADKLSAALEASEEGDVKILIDRRDLPYARLRSQYRQRA